MHYLTKEQILFIHSVIIDETSGSHGVRDMHALLSLVQSPAQKVFGKELYPTIFDKAALYARDIIMNYPFIDGNKRTGITAASVFLENHDYEIIAHEGEFEEFALRIVSEKLEIDVIAGWLKAHSKNLKSRKP